MLFLRETILNRLLPFCGLLALLTFSAGCDSDSNTGGTATDPGGTNTLFQEDFAGTTLAAAWSASNFSATSEIDSTIGQPAPSLHIYVDSGVNGKSFVTLSQPYNNAGGISFTIEVEVDNSGRAGLNSDWIKVVIHDQGRNQSQAGMTIRRFTDGSDNVNISYDVYPGGPWQQVKEWNIVLSPGFHEFKFTVYPDFTAKWFRDGIQRLSTLTGQQMFEADLQLKLEVRGPETAAYFDNALVSR